MQLTKIKEIDTIIFKKLQESDKKNLSKVNKYFNSLYYEIKYLLKAQKFNPTITSKGYSKSWRDYYFELAYDTLEESDDCNQCNKMIFIEELFKEGDFDSLKYLTLNRGMMDLIYDETCENYKGLIEMFDETGKINLTEDQLIWLMEHGFILYGNGIDYLIEQEYYKSIKCLRETYNTKNLIFLDEIRYAITSIYENDESGLEGKIEITNITIDKIIEIFKDDDKFKKQLIKLKNKINKIIKKYYITK